MAAHGAAAEPNERQQIVSEKEALQRAADEARKAARRARELAGLLDDYAKYIVQPNWRERADDLRLSASNKVREVNDGLAASAPVEQSGEPEELNVRQTEQEESNPSQVSPIPTASPAKDVASPAGGVRVKKKGAKK